MGVATSVPNHTGTERGGLYLGSSNIASCGERGPCGTASITTKHSKCCKSVVVVLVFVDVLAKVRGALLTIEQSNRTDGSSSVI